MYRFGTESNLGKKMKKIRERRGNWRPDPEVIDQDFIKLSTCHQPDGGPCKLTITKDPDDKRCRMSRKMQVSCPYIGRVDPLKDDIRKQEEDKELDDLIYEPPPKVSV